MYIVELPHFVSRPAPFPVQAARPVRPALMLTELPIWIHTTFMVLVFRHFCHIQLISWCLLVYCLDFAIRLPATSHPADIQYCLHFPIRLAHTWGIRMITRCQCIFVLQLPDPWPEDGPQYYFRSGRVTRNPAEIFVAGYKFFDRRK